MMLMNMQILGHLYQVYWERIMIRTAKTIASESCEEIYALLKFSITPKRIPPIIAPGMEPIPPNTAATKALRPGMDPDVGITPV